MNIALAYSDSKQEKLSMDAMSVCIVLSTQA